MRKRLVKKRKGSSEPKEKLKNTKKDKKIESKFFSSVRKEDKRLKKREKEEEKNSLASQEDRGVALTNTSVEYPPVDISFSDSNDGGDERNEKNNLRSLLRGREDRIKLICVFTVIFSLFAAVAITCYAFAVSYGHIVSGSEAESEEVTESESGKIVFVKPYDDGSGILTPPEIYETRRESVVTVEFSLGSELQGGNGVCTGFVISEDGYIATVAHALSGAESISVITCDGHKYDARTVATDGESDIALLKIQASDLKKVEMSGSDELLVGENVYSIGTPASVDYAGTFFAGQVSYPLRTVTVYSNTGGVSKRLKLIQLDGKFNQGSSGSPVFDEYGRVIGMVTMRLSGDYTDVCFAIPSVGAQKVLSAMMNGRELDSEVLSGVLSFAARLGIVGENGEENGVFGVRITDFEQKSEVRGILKSGDLIVRIDNTEVRRQSDLVSAIGKKNRGEGARVTVVRGGQYLTFEVVCS